MTVAAVVLAAGAATRYGSPKQLVFLPAVLERLAQTSVEEVVVVEGAYPLLDLSLDDATPLPGTMYKVQIAKALVGRARDAVA